MAGEAQNLTLGDFSASLFDLPPGLNAEIRSWRFQNDPFRLVAGDGWQLVEFSNQRLSVVRATPQSGITRCFMAYRCLITTFGWTTRTGANPGFGQTVDILDAQGNDLFQWSHGKLNVECGDKERFGLWCRDLRPDVFDKIDAALLSYQGCAWKTC